MSPSSSEAARSAAENLQKQALFIVSPLSAERRDLAVYLVGFCEGVRAMLYHASFIPEPGVLVDIVPAAITDGLKELRLQDGHSLQDLALHCVRFAQDHLAGQPAWPVDVSEATTTVYRDGNDDGQNAVQMLGGFNKGLPSLATKQDRLKDDLSGSVGG